MAIKDFGVLAGVKVVSSATVVAGPFAAGLLAENGAELITIEHPRVPDTGKAFGLLYNAEHRNAKSLSMDMKTDEAKEIFRKLIADADIFIESARPGVWGRLGFSDEALWEIKPDLVIVHVSGYGGFGDPDYVRRAAYDQIGQGFSGYTALNGMPGDDMPPMYAKPYACDYFTGFSAAFGAVSALYRARQTGQGESIDVAMFETMARLQAGYSVEGLTDGTQPKRNGTADAIAAIDVVYKSKDGKWVVLAIASPNEKWIEAIGLGDDPDFHPASFVAWGQPRADKYVEYTHRFAETHTLDELLDIAESCGLAACPVMTYDLMGENPHYQARNTIIEWDDPQTGRTLKGITTIPRFKNRPGEVFRGSPTLGMDNKEILNSLGYDDDEIAALAEKGTLGK